MIYKYILPSYCFYFFDSAFLQYNSREKPVTTHSMHQLQCPHRASKSTGVPARIYAVEKNLHAVITLRNRAVVEEWENVRIIEKGKYTAVSVLFLWVGVGMWGKGRVSFISDAPPAFLSHITSTLCLSSILPFFSPSSVLSLLIFLPIHLLPFSHCPQIDPMTSTTPSTCTPTLPPDMRRWTPSELSDIMVSELLGSWGDNELSPECLDIAQEKCLKENGVNKLVSMLKMHRILHYICTHGKHYWF